MRRLLKRYWLLIPLIVLAVVVRDWVEEAPTVITVEDTIDMRETRADYYLEDFTTQRYDAQGKLSYRVTGETLAHYPADDRSEIIAPRLSVYRQDIHWQVRSRTGDLTRNPDVFTLRGDVELVRNSGTHAPIVMRTGSLAIAPLGNHVRTGEPIEIVAPSWQLKSVGLESSLDEGRLTLLSDVSGRFELPVPLHDAENKP